jgi:hypothetical protein
MFESTKTTSSVAHCSADLADEMLGGAIPTEGKYGYRLIDNKLVPISFLDRIEYHLVSTADSTTFDPTKVFTAKSMIRAEFWESLDTDEQEVLPACLFLMIDEGRITFTFPG